MSWGFTEMSNESSYDSYFTTPAGQAGITFIAASGDDGVVEYPATSPNVLSVGGTTLNLSGSGTYGSETAWIDSGGGYSQYEPEPGYQESVQQTGMRSTPDVSFDGDPNTGVEVYATPPGESGLVANCRWHEPGARPPGPGSSPLLTRGVCSRACQASMAPRKPYRALMRALPATFTPWRPPRTGPGLPAAGSRRSRATCTPSRMVLAS